MLMENTAPAGSVAMKPAKKSLFNRPAGRRPLPQAASTTESIFERSKQSFDAILAERQRKQRAHEAHEEEQPQTTQQREPYGAGSRKKRRVSEDSDGGSGSDRGSHKDTKKHASHRYCPSVHSSMYCTNQTSPSPKSTSIGSVEPPQKVWTSPRRAQKERDVPNQGSGSPVQPTSEIIDLGSGSDTDSDTDHLQHSKGHAGSSKRPQQDRDEENDSAEEFPELAAAARARARQLAQEGSTKPVPEAIRRSPAVSLNPASSGPPDPVVQLLITSPISGSNPLIVRRKLSQRLQEVRAAWCARQEFPPPITEADVFLTWRGRRIFDVTSCKSLGIAVDAMGTVFIPGQNKVFGSKDVEGLDEDDEDGAVKVHLEAVTKEILEQLKNERAQRKLQQEQATRSGRLGDGEAVSDAGGAAEQHDANSAQVRIILKAKGLADYKIIVRPVRNSQLISLVFHKIGFPRIY